MVQISYGNHIRPIFESVEYSKLDKHNCLVRPVHVTSSNKLKPTVGDIQQTSNLVIPDTSNVRVIGGHTASSIEKSASALKRKITSSDKGESLAMVDR